MIADVTDDYDLENVAALELLDSGNSKEAVRRLSLSLSLSISPAPTPTLNPTPTLDPNPDPQPYQVRDANHSTIMANKEISELKQILGLQQGKVRPPPPPPPHPPPPPPPPPRQPHPAPTAPRPPRRRTTPTRPRTRPCATDT